MPLTKQKGNMYEWITHVWNAVLGECPNKCTYCYVKTSFWTKDLPHYKGEQRFNEKDENINLGKGRTIFVCHTNDLFTCEPEIIFQVLELCSNHIYNTYVFQTKKPSNVLPFLQYLPINSIIGTTIETDDDKLLSKYSEADTYYVRKESIEKIHYSGFRTFITIEPIMKFTPMFHNDLVKAQPTWINIGADSKNNKLIEPTWEEVEDLIEDLKYLDIEVKEKSNLERLKKTSRS